jgi:flagellar export protein FliJ
MRSQESIQILLRVRSQREDVEERKLAAIIERLRLAQAQLATLLTELENITASRLSEVQCIFPNTHHQAVEMDSKTLWRQCADHVAEIERLKNLQAQQMSVYLTAHREREVVEKLNKERNDALEMERRLREQKRNEDLFLARRVAKWDT